MALTDPVEDSQVKAWLSITDDRLDAVVASCTAAANDLVLDLPIAKDVDQDTATEWPDRLVTGGTMLAARLVRRRNSPSGVEALTDQGAAYVSRNDPDIAQLLKIGAYAPPRVG